MYVRSIIVSAVLLLGAPEALQAERTRGVASEATGGMTGVVEAVDVSSRAFRMAGRVFFVPDGVADFEKLAPKEMVTVYWKPGDKGPEVLSLELSSDR